MRKKRKRNGPLYRTDSSPYWQCAFTVNGRRRDWSPATRGTALAELSGAFSHALRRDQIDAHPMRDGGARVAGVEWPEVPFWSVSKVGK